MREDSYEIYEINWRKNDLLYRKVNSGFLKLHGLIAILYFLFSYVFTLFTLYQFFIYIYLLFIFGFMLYSFTIMQVRPTKIGFSDEYLYIRYASWRKVIKWSLIERITVEKEGENIKRNQIARIYLKNADMIRLGEIGENFSMGLYKEIKEKWKEHLLKEV